MDGWRWDDLDGYHLILSVAIEIIHWEIGDIFKTFLIGFDMKAPKKKQSQGQLKRE